MGWNPFEVLGLGSDMMGDSSEASYTRDFLTSGTSAGLAGAASGNPYVAAGAFVLGGLLGAEQGEASREAAEEERQRLEEARIDAVRREYGIMQSKQNGIVARARNNNIRSGGGQAQNNAGDVNASQALSESGFLGQNIINTGGSTPSAASGTF